MVQIAYHNSWDDAIALGTAHEQDTDDPGQEWGSPESNKDLVNNEKGANIGRKFRERGLTLGSAMRKVVRKGLPGCRRNCLMVNY